MPDTRSRKCVTYWFGTKGVVLTFGCVTSPIAKIPPPFILSKQCAKIFFTFPDEASWESMDEFACPKPRIPSRASEDEPSSPDCLSPHLLKGKEKSMNKESQARIAMLHNRRSAACKLPHTQIWHSRWWMMFEGFQSLDLTAHHPSQSNQRWSFHHHIPHYTGKAYSACILEGDRCMWKCRTLHRTSPGFRSMTS